MGSIKKLWKEECFPFSDGVYSEFWGTFLVDLEWGTIEVYLDLEDELKGKYEDSADSITIYKTEERSLWRHKREVDSLLRRMFAITVHFHEKLAQTKVTKDITKFRRFCSCSEYITTGTMGKKMKRFFFLTRWVFSVFCVSLGLEHWREYWTMVL